MMNLRSINPSSFMRKKLHSKINSSTRNKNVASVLSSTFFTPRFTPSSIYSPPYSSVSARSIQTSNCTSSLFFHASRQFTSSSRALLADAQTSSSSSSSSGTGSGSLSLRFVTPNETIVNNETVYMVTVPAVTGVMGILADHAPTIAQLQPGLVTVYRNDLNDVSHRLFVSGGFAVVNNESNASITAVEAINLDDLDLNAARNALSEAQALLARVSGEKEKAEAQISIEVYEGLIAALESK